jgi:hypothetical protein
LDIIKSAYLEGKYINEEGEEIEVDAADLFTKESGNFS